jgi:hypothetical protein
MGTNHPVTFHSLADLCHDLNPFCLAPTPVGGTPPMHPGAKKRKGAEGGSGTPPSYTFTSLRAGNPTTGRKEPQILLGVSIFL